MKTVILFACIAFLLVAPVVAQQSSQPEQPDNAALMQKIRDLEDRVILLEGQVRTLKSQPATPVAARSLRTGLPPSVPMAKSEPAST